MGYRALAIGVVAFHFAFLAYVVAGGFLALRWRWTLWPHLAACAWGIAIVTVPGLDCPLTFAENWARQQAGWGTYQGGFINRYVENVLYPSRFTPLVQVLTGIVVVTSWVLFYLRRRDRLAPAPR